MWRIQGHNLVVSDICCLFITLLIALLLGRFCHFEVSCDMRKDLHAKNKTMGVDNCNFAGLSIMVPEKSTREMLMGKGMENVATQYLFTSCYI